MRKLTALILFALIGLPTLYGCAAPLLVAGGAAVGVTVMDRREPDIVLNDKAITFDIEKAIYTDESIKHHIHVNAVSYNGVVLLTGETTTANMRQKVVEHTQKVQHVRKIYNETIVAPSADHQSRRQDAWITTKVKAGLIAAKEINGMHFKVVTESQTVYLMGIVSKKEGNIAATVAQKVRGVKQVVKIFEYKP